MDDVEEEGEAGQEVAVIEAFANDGDIIEYSITEATDLCKMISLMVFLKFE